MLLAAAAPPPLLFQPPVIPAAAVAAWNQSLFACSSESTSEAFSRSSLEIKSPPIDSCHKSSANKFSSKSYSKLTIEIYRTQVSWRIINAWTSSIVLGDRRPGGGGEISLPLFPKTSYMYRQRGPAGRKNFGLANGKRSTCSLRAERDRQKKSI